MNHLYCFTAVLVVRANVAFHIDQKSIPTEINPALSVVVTYSVALVLSFGLLCFFPIEGGVGARVERTQLGQLVFVGSPLQIVLQCRLRLD